MAMNRIMRGRAMRRVPVAAALLVLAFALVACGGGDGESATDKQSDIGVLNEVLGRQLAVVEAYGRALPVLHNAADIAAVQTFRAQEQEHVDATTKALRALEGEADPVADEIVYDPIRTRRQAFEFLYWMESATIDFELHALGELTIDWPRPLIGSMATNQAQRLVLIRQALGADSLEAIPEAFETGETPAPEEMMEP